MKIATPTGANQEKTKQAVIVAQDRNPGKISNKR